MNLPNKLTIARIIAVPFFIAAYYLEWHLVAFLIFIPIAPHFNILLSDDTIFALLEKAYSTLTLFDYCVAVSLRSVNLKIELF